MKKSDELIEELKTLTDAFAISCMKKRIAFAIVKEQSRAMEEIKSDSVKLVTALTIAIDKFSRDMMKLDHDNEKEKVVDIHEIQGKLIEARKVFVEFVKKNKSQP